MYFRLKSLVLFVLLLLLASLSGCTSDSPPGATPQLAPDFTLRTLTGETVSLSQYRGKVVFINFWATWCPPCRAELPSMQRLNEVFAGRDFVMLAVNVDVDSAEVLPEFFKEYPHSYSVLLDVEASVQELYGVDKLPETFIIDKQGKVVERVLGARDWSATPMLQRFNTLIAAP